LWSENFSAVRETEIAKMSEIEILGQCGGRRERERKRERERTPKILVYDLKTAQCTDAFH